MRSLLLVLVAACSSSSLSCNEKRDDAPDLAARDLAARDLSAPDLWTPDLQPPSDLSDPYTDAGQPPAISCGAGDDAGCPLPKSECLDYRYLIYYTNPTCTGGACQWERRLHDCQEQSAGFLCITNSGSGACDYGLTS